MAGDFSPVVPEAEVRQYPVGGYDGAQPYNYLSRQVSNVGDAALSAFESEDADLTPLAKRAKDLVSRAAQVNDITGRPVQSRQRTVTERANLIADAAVIGGPDGVRFVSSILDSALGGELGVTSSNAALKAREDYYQKRDEAGILSVGPDASEEAIALEGDRILRVQEEDRISKSKIELAQAQLQLEDGNYNYNKRIIQDEASSIASRYSRETLQPFFKQLAESDLSDPATVAANRNNLLAAQAQVALTLRENFDDLGLDFNTQSEIMGQVNTQFQYMDQGMDIMAGIPAAKIKQIQAMNQLTEIELGTLLGQMLGTFGPETIRYAWDSLAVQDPNYNVEYGKSLGSFFARGNQARQALRLNDLSTNPEATMELAVKIINGQMEGTDPRDLSSFADASKTLTAGALDADYNSQLNAIEMMSNPTYLANLQKTNDPVALSNVALFHQEMATRLALMIGQAAEQTEGITVTPNPDGTLTPDWEGWAAAINDAQSPTTGAPTRPSLVPGLSFGSAINARSTFSQLQKMVESYNKSVNSLNTLSGNLPRGLRNNNPGNIKATPTQWQGEVSSSDPTFESFSGPDKGVRAIGKLMKTNQNLTVNDWINKYAPSTENNTAAYVSAVEKAGIDVSKKVSEVNSLDLTKAIIQHENGVQPFHDEFILGALNG